MRAIPTVFNSSDIAAVLIRLRYFGDVMLIYHYGLISFLIFTPSTSSVVLSHKWLSLKAIRKK